MKFFDISFPHLLVHLQNVQDCLVEHDQMTMDIDGPIGLNQGTIYVYMCVFAKVMAKPMPGRHLVAIPPSLPMSST